jgi:hypothetical protein
MEHSSAMRARRLPDTGSQEARAPTVPACHVALPRAASLPKKVGGSAG